MRPRCGPSWTGLFCVALALAARPLPGQTFRDWKPIEPAEMALKQPVEIGHDLELPPGLATRERVGMKDLRDEARPTRGRAALLGGLLFNRALSRLLLARSLETNVPGFYLAGAVVSGKNTGRIFIENGRFHAEAIVSSITSARR